LYLHLSPGPEGLGRDSDLVKQKKQPFETAKAISFSKHQASSSAKEKEVVGSDI